MLGEERKEYILNEIHTNGKVQVVAMANRLQVSAETIRRDIDTLAETENIRRVHGGAIKMFYAEGEPSYNLREDMNFDAKQAIGKEASLLINNGDTIFLDTGTTIEQLARFVSGKERLIILTNSLPTAMLLNESMSQQKFTGKLIMLGGETSSHNQTISGSICEKMLERFYVDKAFISVGGISIERGISDYDLNEAEISKIACSISKEVIVLADESKIGVQSFSSIAPMDSVNAVISNGAPPSPWIEKLALLDVTWKTTG